jgi:hypothetical protein
MISWLPLASTYVHVGISERARGLAFVTVTVPSPHFVATFKEGTKIQASWLMYIVFVLFQNIILHYLVY